MITSMLQDYKEVCTPNGAHRLYNLLFLGRLATDVEEYYRFAAIRFNLTSWS